MNACANAYGMRMPARFADMTPDEIEYDGIGFRSWWKRNKKNVLKAVAIAAVITICVVAPVAIVGIGALMATSATTAAGATVGLMILANSYAIGYCSIRGGATVTNPMLELLS